MFQKNLDHQFFFILKKRHAIKIYQRKNKFHTHALNYLQMEDLIYAHPKNDISTI